MKTMMCTLKVIEDCQAYKQQGGETEYKFSYLIWNQPVKKPLIENIQQGKSNKSISHINLRLSW
jgi:hypothetical protein